MRRVRRRANAVAGMSFARRREGEWFEKVVWMWVGRVFERERRELRIVGGTTCRARGERMRVISWDVREIGSGECTLYIAKSAFWTQGARAGELRTR